LDVGAYEFLSGLPADLVITTMNLPNGTVGVGYSRTLAATGRINPYTWSIKFGSLPAGLFLNSLTAVICGNPTAAGTSAFTVQVRDSQNPPDTDAKPFSITINTQQDDPLTITTRSLPNARRNKSYNQTLQATGGLSPYLWSIDTSSLPPGLSLNTLTGALSGKATIVGTWSLTVNVKDSQGSPASDRQPLSIIVTR
jgi:hypothetical protein